MHKLIKLMVKLALWLNVAGVLGFVVQRKQLDEKVLMGFEKYFRAMIGQIGRASCRERV